MSNTDDLLRAGAAYAQTFEKGGLPAPPARRVAIVACMDARLDPARILGLEEGDAHVIRNAGGLVTDDAVRSLAMSQRLLGTQEVVLLRHTDCGMLGFSDEEFKARLQEETGTRPEWSVEGFSDLDEGVRRSIEQIASDPLLLHRDSVRGFVYEVESGRLRDVR